MRRSVRQRNRPFPERERAVSLCRDNALPLSERQRENSL